MRRPERGMVLLEALLALAILAIGGTALLAAMGAAVRSERGLRAREQALQAGDRVLTALALLSRNDLDRRLGRHPVDDFLVEIQRPEPTLYRIGLRESRAPETEALVTVVYRPEDTAR
jgi:type II secretory pathway pseudopilin PulG